MSTTVPTSNPSVAVLRDPESAAAALPPLRRELIAALGERPDSAAGLARRLGESRQRLNYHLRALEDAGLVELVEERRRGNCVERILRTTARRFVVDPGSLGELGADPAELQDRFSVGYLIALAARAIGELAGLRDTAEEEGKRLATTSIETRVRLGSPADFEAFTRDLSEAVARVVNRYHDETASGGRPFRVLAGAYPAPTDPEADPPADPTPTDPDRTDPDPATDEERKDP